MLHETHGHVTKLACFVKFYYDPHGRTQTLTFVSGKHWFHKSLTYQPFSKNNSI